MDSRTLVLVWTMTALVLGSVQLGLWLGRRGDRELLYLTAANLIGFVGSLLLVLRGFVPYWISVGLGNACFILWLLMVWAGIRQFCGYRVPLPAIFASALLMFGVMMLPFMATHFNARVALVSGLITVIMSLGVFDLWRAQKQEQLDARPFLAGVMAALALAAWARAIGSIGLGPVGDLFNGGRGDQIFLLLFDLFMVSMNVIMLLMINQRLRGRLEHAARHDPVTGLLTGTAFIELADHRIAEARVRQQPVAMLVMSLRTLRSYNPHLALPGAEPFLREVAKRLRDAARDQGALVARFGGEQFAWMIPNCDADSAESAAVRLCRELDGLRVPHPGSPQGVAKLIVGIRSAHAARISTASAMVEDADVALLRARQLDADRVVMF